jgi:hypothetical protein
LFHTVGKENAGMPENHSCGSGSGRIQTFVVGSGSEDTKIDILLTFCAKKNNNNNNNNNNILFSP